MKTGLQRLKGNQGKARHSSPTPKSQGASVYNKILKQTSAGLEDWRVVCGVCTVPTQTVDRLLSKSCLQQTVSTCGLCKRGSVNRVKTGRGGGTGQVVLVRGRDW